MRRTPGATLLIFLTGFTNTLADGCLPRDYGNGATVCVCNELHCDTISHVEKLSENAYITYTSNKDDLRFREHRGLFQYSSEISDNPIITIRFDEVYQDIHGWGGCFTDATCINIKSLPGTVQEKLMRSYFSEDGLEYNLGRVPIGATDFSTHPYSYHDEEDVTLSNFSLATEDYDFKIPLIHEAQNLTNNNMQFFASAWVAPKWMKTNGNYSGFLGFLKESMYQPWTDYFIKFLDAYKNENISFWGITTGNEPSLAWTPAKVPSVAWFPAQQSKWIQNNLGPALRNSSYSEIKIMAIDDQRFNLPWFLDGLFESEEVKNYIDGIAVHWYWDLLIGANVLNETHDKYPDKFILGTEACRGDRLFDTHVILGSWERAEDYATSIIEDVNHWVAGWMEWCMALDTTGGPTYIDNYVDAAIIVNASAGEFYKQPTYYAIGHFSKFVPRGSKRIFASQIDDDVPVTAFRRPDDGVVVAILNKKNETVTLTIMDQRRGNIELNLTRRSPDLFTVLVDSR